MKTAIIVTTDPIVAPLAEQAINADGVEQMLAWVKDRRPECVPDESGWQNLFPHALNDIDGRELTDNELLVELAGRKCYDSFGLKAGKKTNAEYIANTQAGDIPHGSIMYHAKMTFFIAGVSRRVSHELIRHYVGADRDEEGSPSQESTRYVEHSGRYIAHPAYLGDEHWLSYFEVAMQDNYSAYLKYIRTRSTEYEQANSKPPTGMDRKRIFESASPFLSHACETSFIWSTNPIALAKLFKERDNEAADLEFLRLARVWKKVALARWPNLFPQPWLHAGSP